MIWDTFMFNNELDMLECRLLELEGVPNLVHVAVEADVDHQDHPKPFHLSENIERFAPWKERLRVVRATGLPTAADNPDAWAREVAQREYAPLGMEDAAADDLILHGDVDEIPRAVVARNIRIAGPQTAVALDMRGHFWSLRWRYPVPWGGTVAMNARDVRSFERMRSLRNAPAIERPPDAGWHLSWLGGPQVAMQKVGSFCHPEVEERIVDGLASNRFLVDGVHVDGVRMERCDLSDMPRYVTEGRCPESWLL